MHFTENLYAFRRNLMNLASNQDNISFCWHNFAVISLAYHERLVWAKRNIQNKSRETFEKTVELDVSKMPSNAGFRLKPAVGGIRGSTLIVTISIPTGEEPQAQINTRVSRGRRTFKHDGKYKIRL
jgi:hypothetical protein